MNRTASAFLLVTVLAGLLTALGFGLQIKGYGFGRLGAERLDALAGAASFIPLAALYSFAAALVMIVPLRAAGYLHGHGLTPLFSASLVLLATLVGVRIARFAFGEARALQGLVDWRFVFALAILVAHLSLDALRRNALLRTLSFVTFLLAALACLYWTFG